MNNRPDHEIDVDYQFHILHKMLEQLPETAQSLCIDQVEKIKDTIINRENNIKKRIVSQLEDLRLEIKSMRFDLESTRAERDNLQKIIDNL